jgi:peptidoglycan hydrolase CwlO-like protein
MVHPTPRAAVLALTAGLLLVPSAGASSTTTLQHRLDARDRRAQVARRGLHADRSRLQAVTARVHELEGQLAPLDTALRADVTELDRLQGELRTTRSRLTRLRAEAVEDRRVLAEQLVAQYEAPSPGIADVVLDARGYADLLGRVGQLRRIAERNARVTERVREARDAADTAQERLQDLAGRKAATVATERTRRDAVAHVRLELVQQQATIERRRDRHGSRLRALGRQEDRLRSQLVEAQRAAAKAAGVPLSGGASPQGGYGFFPAAGTNYGVHDEPELATRLAKMAKELHLHLIGLSGYRTPQHSVEVGGFPNDPHTRGQASDTPGVEGVSEATLEQFGLTRPFGGAAEADHIQLLGG